MPYDEYQLALLPPWLQGLNGEAYATAVGLLKDAVVEGMIAAVKARWLLTCPPDALSYLGQERNLEALPGESVPAYRARLLSAWTLWSFAGTKAGVLLAIEQLGYPNVTILENGDWAWPPSPGDVSGQEWWRFWVIINPPNPFSSALVWGDGSLWGGGKPWGIGLSPAQSSALGSVLAKWKPAHALLVRLIILLAGRLWGYPTVTWGQSGVTWGGKAAYLNF